MDPTALLYGAMLVVGAQKARDDEQKRKEERKERDAYWEKFHDRMDRTFGRGKHRKRGA